MSIRITVKRIVSFFCTTAAKRQVGHAGTGFRVNYPSIFTKKTTVGEFCHFNGIAIYGNGKVSIGDHFHSGKHIKVFTSNHNFDGGTELPYDSSMIDRDVVIGDNVWLGEDVVILGGVTIGEGAVIQNSSVVCRSVPPLAVAGGHPAVPFKYRDRQHYEELKKAGRFKK